MAQQLQLCLADVLALLLTAAVCMLAGSEAMMKHGGIAALLELLNDGHLEAWASATHTLHMLCTSTPSATLMIMQAGVILDKVFGRCICLVS